MQSAELTAGRERRSPWRAVLPWAAPLAYVGALATASALRGLPTSRDALYLWILLGLLAFSVADLRRWGRGVLLEWLPFGAVLFAYDLLRGQADKLFEPYVEPQLRADELAFGTVPTVWLQQRLWDGPGAIDWIDYAAWAVYLTHFFGTFVAAAVLWLVASRLFRRYAAMVALLAVAGFLTYLLFPAVPPWMASDLGALAPTDRIVRFVSAEGPIEFFGAVWERGAEYANDVAAVPSLHAAYALLITLFFFPLVRAWPWRLLLLAYPLAMAFALVYTAEHYVSDVVLGWAYAAAAFVGVERAARRLERP